MALLREQDGGVRFQYETLLLQPAIATAHVSCHVAGATGKGITKSRPPIRLGRGQSTVALAASLYVNRPPLSQIYLIDSNDYADLTVRDCHGLAEVRAGNDVRALSETGLVRKESFNRWLNPKTLHRAYFAALVGPLFGA